MTREIVRILKRGTRKGRITDSRGPGLELNRECALALLSRSIRFSHGRLAVIRLAMAVDVGAAVPTEHWLYCSHVARSSGDSQLQELYRAAAVRAADVQQAPGPNL